MQPENEDKYKELATNVMQLSHDKIITIIYILVKLVKHFNFHKHLSCIVVVMVPGISQMYFLPHYVHVHLNCGIDH